jgi:S-DNA-T family DNA segregation ATPase FtsK/SpoIIIE
MIEHVINLQRQWIPSLLLFIERRLREAVLLVALGIGVMGIVALASYSPTDPGWSFTGHGGEVANQMGLIGAWMADISLYLFGFGGYLLPLALAWLGVEFYRLPLGSEMVWRLPMNALRWGGLLLALVAASGFAALQLKVVAVGLPMGAGGILGGLLLSLSEYLPGFLAASVLMLASLVLGVTLYTELSWFRVMELMGGLMLGVMGGLVRWSMPGQHPEQGAAHNALEATDTGHVLEAHAAFEVELTPASYRTHGDSDDGVQDDRAEPSLNLSEALLAVQETEYGSEPELHLAVESQVEEEPALSPAESFVRQVKENLAALVRKPMALAPERSVHTAQINPELKGALPSLDLLDRPKPKVGGYSPQALEILSRQVESILKDFGVSATVVEVNPGPVVTLFELDLAPGTKASKVTGLANDLARSLSTSRVRVVEVIPGKTTIGLEIPNEKREMVVLREIMGSEVYQKAESLLTLSLGKDIAGEPVVADLAKMPHALIAGTTGSGKSVAINTMILSLLYKAKPEDVRLIMVDPKMLELSVYEGIPHLLTPVVTDMKEAANALRWCVAEMERRYKLMASQGVRNIKGYNHKVETAIADGAPIPDPFFNPALALSVDAVPTLEKMPYIVVVIDELADMMMVVGKKVEELIARLAQKARAAGIHLLLATQRPSVDVITGLIKANIPTRFSFQVSSRIDSRTILDQMGAENLLGHGDGLYLAPGGSVVKRVHGAFVDDHEVHAVVEFLKQTGEPNYIADILREPTDAIPGLSPEAAGVDLEDNDPLYDEAVEFVIQSRSASISSVQRKLKIGYNRAARLIEEMERTGVVSAPEHNGNRQVLAPPAYED